LNRSRRLVATLAALAALTTLVAACGDDDDATDAAASDACAPDDADFPVTIDNDGTDVELDAPPAQIVSLSATATESLFAIGAGCQVTAVDDQSNFPAEAPMTDLSGYEPNVEAIAAEEPDLVVMSDSTPDAVAGLRKLGIPVLVQPAAVEIDDIYAQIDELGEVTGRAKGASTVVGKVRQQLADVAQEADGATELTYYHELDDQYYSVTSETFIGKLYELIGLKSIADDAKGASDYPQLSAELVLQKNPDLVLLADSKCCKQDASTVAARPGWAAMKAVTKGGVVVLDDDIASRWGPRVADLARQVAAAAKKARAAA
jgi:iron complex transport system substrate-binding protein